jgi:hypothetical protein
VVTEQAGLAILFVLDSGWREHDFFQVSDNFVAQDCPELVLDELGHFLS